MDALPVTLIVKAPNQQIEDQIIKCELSWTINKLKQHLSEVYPSKPAKHEQKLIYSGQLLPDTVVLGDILRQYDGQETHTVHLVCTIRQTTPKHQPAPPKPQPAMPDASTSPQISTASNAEQQIPNVQWPNIPPMDPNQYALQMAWMQHAYMQYMTQYMNLNANGAFNNTNGVVNNQDVAEEDPQPAPQRQRDQENGDRDWLDLIYILTRILILLSVVYFYSTALRFVMVFGIAFGFYLYQIGFFRNLNNNNNNHNNNNVQDGQGDPEVQRSYLTMAWVFVTTFFSSLVPEVPQVV